MDDSFPGLRRLRNGTQLASFAHAVMLPMLPQLEHERAWEDDVHLLQNSQGAQGAIAFRDVVIGAFFEPYSPLRDNPLSPESWLALLPHRHREVAEAWVFPYLQQDGSEPEITALFWSDEGRLTANQGWGDVMMNGAHLLATDLLPLKRALRQMRADYDMPPELAELARRLFIRWLARGDGFSVHADELTILSDSAVDEDAFAASIRMLTEDMGIFLDLR